MKIEAIVEKHVKALMGITPDNLVANELRAELRKSGHHIESLEVGPGKIVVRTKTEVFVHTF